MTPIITVPDSVALLRHRPLLLYLTARGLAEFAYQIAAVAVGWQVYALTNSAFALGLVGLVQFIPSLLLVFVTGHVADRYDRRRVVQICQLIEAVAATFLAWGSYAGWITVPEIFAALVLFGTAGAFVSPALGSLLPAVAPVGRMQQASALSTAMMQAGILGGPALGGFAYVLSPGAPYAMMALFCVLAAILNGAIVVQRVPVEREPISVASVFAGFAFVRRTPAVFGTISLDLFAVLLGGATALMPIFARDILHTGPWGLGILRGAPAVGALVMTMVLARHSLQRRVGLRMFQAVIAFGLATVLFALSQQLWLSVVALVAMGAADTVSMVIRISLVQLSTPDAMRGRVSAVNYLFVNASNQLGEFESGMTAAFFGAMPAALIGGIGTVLVALLWMRLFPSLRHVERLEGAAD